MKQHLTAIAFNEKELESYVSQLITGGFEAISEVKKAEDGTWFQALAKAAKQEMPKLTTTVSEVESTQLSA